jgi:hypothetical protein
LAWSPTLLSWGWLSGQHTQPTQQLALLNWASQLCVVYCPLQAGKLAGHTFAVSDRKSEMESITQFDPVTAYLCSTFCRAVCGSAELELILHGAGSCARGVA